MKRFFLIALCFAFLGAGCVSVPATNTTTTSILPVPSLVDLTTEQSDVIRLETPRALEMVKSPLVIRGEAPGTWFFEASFPVTIVDWDGRIIGQGIAQAQGDWMTTDLVPFEATLTFTTDPQVYSNRGALILQKDNPSGLSVNDDSVEISVIIEGE